MSFINFHGPPCLQHNNYVFYKAFKYKYFNESRVLSVGDFFFLRIVEEMHDCIGEIELLWEDKATCQILSSVRLYFRPEHTPDGRQDDTGEDEVVALGERLALRLEDLVPLIQHDIKWTYGCPTFCSTKTPTRNGSLSNSHEDLQEDTKLRKNEVFENSRNGIVVKDGDNKKRHLCLEVSRMDNSAGKDAVSGAANVAVMSYPRYCRYRAIQKRLEGCEDEWLHLAAVIAIGGFSGKLPGCRVMFCRDTFYQAEIDDLDIRMDHMLPVLKSRAKGRKGRQLSRKDSQQDSDSMDEMFLNVTPSILTSSRPRRLTESSEVNEEKVSTEEQAFLIGLHKFMHDAKMPIGRIPCLGFKQIDLYYFYKEAEKLGGYDSITHKRMWKHLYDKLGGNTSNTSAATCTRKHYERLLLPYERHLRKLKVRKAKKKRQKASENGSEVKNEIVLSDLQKDVEVEPECEVKEEIMELEVKENLRQPVSESVNNSQSESVICTDKVEQEVTEHSKLNLQDGSEVLDTTASRHHVRGENAFSYTDRKAVDGGSVCQRLSFSQVEKLHQKPTQKAFSVPPSSPVILGENHSLPYSNVMYRGGYLVPVLPHMLHSPWGMMAPPSSPSAAPSQIAADVSASHSVTGFKDRSVTSFHSSSKVNQVTPGLDIHSKSVSEGKLSHASHIYKPSSSTSSSGSSILKAAHTNTPYKPSPYLLNDHIQPARRSSQCSRLSPVDVVGSSSHSLVSLLHPAPPSHRSQPHLPPAPATIYLHPSAVNPFSPLQSSVMSAPPVAHSHPRKRVYPFDTPTTPVMGVFPSPDIVLDRIRNFTGLPRSSATLANSLSVRQRYEDPRQIFRQAAQSVPASHNVWLPHKEDPLQQQEPASNKQANNKSRNSRKSQQTYSMYSHMTSPELHQTTLQQNHVTPSSNTKLSGQIKPAGNLNGLMSAQQSVKSVPSILQASPVPSSGKDGRLTSALFGTQFTALPRTAKPPDLPSPQSILPDVSSATAAAMSLNPHLHPAFVSPYIPAVTTASPSTLSPQFQMLASSYATPAQLAAYEEMLRQNGYSAFLTAAAQGQLSKKT